MCWIGCPAEFTTKYELLLLLLLFSATDLLLAWNPICLGLVEGVIGKVQLHTGMWHFILYC